MTTDELTDAEIEELEAKAYRYYNLLLENEKATRKESGVPEELTEEEIENFQARAQKFFNKLQIDAVREKRRKQSAVKINTYLQAIAQPEAAQNLTAEQYWQLVIPRLNAIVAEKNPGKSYRLTNDTRFVLEMLCCYFAQDKDFLWYCNQRIDGRPVLITGTPSLEKGLGLFGPTGVGKTDTLRAFLHNPRLSFAYLNAKKLPGIFESEGYMGLSRYYSFQKGVLITHFGQEKIGLFVDDIHAEDVGSHFASSCETVENVLYQRWERLPGNYTHFTTNNKVSELGKRYGSRFEDRMIGSTNLILFPAMPSFRQ